MDVRGSLVCIGTGMMLGAHLAPRARSHVEQADVVFVAVSDPLVELWVQELNADVRSLQSCYAGRSRREAYDRMVALMMAEVRAGRRVCAAFYGHPGVFAAAPHEAIAQARAEGFAAHMEPGISAEDCLYADLGIDPGRHGCQHYEASQFMLYERRVEPSGCLVLWQVGLAGARNSGQLETSAAQRQLLVDLLLETYPPSHEVVLYEAATLPITAPRMERLPLGELAQARLGMQTTLVVPPLLPMRRRQSMWDRIAALQGAAEKEAIQAA